MTLVLVAVSLFVLACHYPERETHTLTLTMQPETGSTVPLRLSTVSTYQHQPHQHYEDGDRKKMPKI